MKENSREEDIEELKRLLYRNELSQYGKRKLINYYEQQEKDYKRVLKENETYKKQYFCLINRIENKIDKFDYEFEKAKRKNDNDRANYYWDLIRNFKKLLESEDNNEII